MEKDLILKPEYLNEFQCAEHNCADSCYLYREIFLTKSQYEEYKKIEIEGIDFNDIIGKLGKNRTEERYAKVRIRKGLGISIKDYLHMINLELGYEYLPNIYKYSPIYYNVINGVYEEVGNLACPQIVNLLSSKKEGIVLINEKITDMNKSIIYKDLITLGSENLIMKYFWDIRLNSLNILLSEKYNLEEKLLLLEIFYSHLDLLNNRDNINHTVEKMDELLTFVSTRNYEVFFKRLPQNEYLNLDILRHIMDMDIESFKNPLYIEEMKINLNGFLPRTDLIDLRTIYLENKKIYDEDMTGKEYILENYMVNQFLKNAIPYINRGKLKELYNKMVVDFIVLKIILIGNSVYRGRLNEELIARKIVSYTRFKIENPRFLEMIGTFIKMEKYDSIESLALILNN